MWGRLQAIHPFRAQPSNPGNIINPISVEAMPKYIPNSRFSDCWASVGNITFYHRDGQCYFRKKSACKFPKTAGQTVTSEIHRRALAAWRTLDYDVQLRWNEYAKAVPSHRPPFDNTTHITGHNLFVSAYHGFAQIGNEHIPEPQEWTPFPLMCIEFISAVEVEDEKAVRIGFKVMFEDGAYAKRYRLHLKMQLASTGAGVRPGLMRTFVAEDNCSGAPDKEVHVLIANYREIWGLSESSNYLAHCRYSLIDTNTGYRNRYGKLSFQLQLSDTQ